MKYELGVNGSNESPVSEQEAGVFTTPGGCNSSGRHAEGRRLGRKGEEAVNRRDSLKRHLAEWPAIEKGRHFIRKYLLIPYR